MEPGPNKEEMQQILACGLRAPDHGRLRPWKFHLVAEGARSKLGEVFAEAVINHGETVQAKIEKCRNMPLRAPLMLVAVCEPLTDHKIPVTDQLLAVGAAVQNMQVAISALGYGSIWRTGDMALAKEVKDAFAVSESGVIVAFLYIGTPEKRPVTPEVRVEDYLSHWI